MVPRVASGCGTYGVMGLSCRVAEAWGRGVKQTHTIDLAATPTPRGRAST